MTDSSPLLSAAERAAPVLARRLLAVALVLCVVACGRPDVQQAEVVRERTTKPQPASSRLVDRFPGLGAAGSRGAGGAANSQPGMAAGASAPPALGFDLPQGWTELPAARFRDVNLQAPGGVDAWVTVMGAGAGGVVMNVNRWRGQLQLPAVDDAAIDQLPRRPLLGGSALAFDETAPDGSKRLVGRMLFADDRSVFVRIAGTPDAVAARLVEFEAFAASLTDAPAAAGPAVSGPAVSGPAGGRDGSAKGVAWTVPEGWVAGQAGQFQDAVWAVAGGLSCALSVYNGEAGGLVANVQRWAGQVGAPMPDIDSLPRLDVLGAQGYVVDLSAGMSSGMLALYAPVGGRSVFVKLTGSGAALQQQRPQFEAFCRSLRLQ